MSVAYERVSVRDVPATEEAPSPGVYKPAVLNGGGTEVAPKLPARPISTGVLFLRLEEPTPVTSQAPSQISLTETEQPTEQLKYLRSELEQLRNQLRLRDAENEWLIAQAASNDDALFILHKLIEADGVELNILTANLEAPLGWIAFAQLWRAGLINYQGDRAIPTDTGKELLGLLFASHT